ncbi:MAG: hypothetical protein MOGMAGMI_00943 [Candidatus Omnitrophica bacterium]|nr:hypothetical protein [Candidatus Omnitrophota bacterium]
MKLDLQDDKHCFVCGPLNSSGFKLRFRRVEPGRLSARVRFDKRHQGFKNIVHGGLIGTILDEVMVNLTWVDGTPAVTGTYTIRLSHPVAVGEEVVFEARSIRTTPRAVYVEAAVTRGADGLILASAEALCVRIKDAPPLSPEIIEEPDQKS